MNDGRAVSSPDKVAAVRSGLLVSVVVKTRLSVAVLSSKDPLPSSVTSRPAWIDWSAPAFAVGACPTCESALKRRSSYAMSRSGLCESDGMDVRDREAQRETSLVRNRHAPQQHPIDVEGLHRRGAAADGEVVASNGNEIRNGRGAGLAGHRERDDHRRVVPEGVRGVDSADSADPAGRVPDAKIDQSDVPCRRAEADPLRKLQLITEPRIDRNGRAVEKRPQGRHAGN